MKNRRGFTLIEMVIVISGLLVVMLVSTRCCYHVIRQRSIAGDFADQHRQWLRLSDTFRRDVHAARRGAVGAEGGELTLSFDEGRTIRYAKFAEGIERTETLAARKPPSTRFRLWNGNTQWALADDGRIATLICQWYPAEAREAQLAGQAPPPREIRIEATVGSDARFSEAQ